MNSYFYDASVNPLTKAGKLYLNNELVTKVDVPEDITSLGAYLFNNASDITSVTIHENFITMRGGRTAYYSAFKNTNIAYTEYNNCNYIGNDENPYIMLVECLDKNITEFNIHPDTKVIENGAFSECNNLTNIVIPEGVESIVTGAFDSCTNLKYLELPSTLKRLGNSTGSSCPFYGCNNLETLICHATNPPEYLSNTNIPSSKLTIYVPDESVDIYKNHEAEKYYYPSWSKHATLIKPISEKP